MTRLLHQAPYEDGDLCATVLSETARRTVKIRTLPSCIKEKQNKWFLRYIYVPIISWGKSRRKIPKYRTEGHEYCGAGPRLAVPIIGSQLALDAPPPPQWAEALSATLAYEKALGRGRRARLSCSFRVLGGGSGYGMGTSAGTLFHPDTWSPGDLQLQVDLLETFPTPTVLHWKPAPKGYLPTPMPPASCWPGLPHPGGWPPACPVTRDQLQPRQTSKRPCPPAA